MSKLFTRQLNCHLHETLSRL